MSVGQRRALVLGLAVGFLVGARQTPAQAAASTTTKGATSRRTHPISASSAAHKTGKRTATHRRSSSKTHAAKSAPGGAHKTLTVSRKGRGRKAKPRRSTAYTRLARMQMDPARVESIQQALINSGAYHGAPTGQWDAQTRDAMARYQTANGFGVTGLPDAKSLMKLGLGPHPLPAELNKAPASAAVDPAGSAGIAPAEPAATPANKSGPGSADPAVAPHPGGGRG